CAQACIAQANLGACEATQATCLCNDQNFITSTTTCFEQTCDKADFQTAEAVALQICSAAGVTFTTTAAFTGTVTGSAAASATSASPSPKSTGSSSSWATSTAVNIGGGAVALGLVVLAI
ncbi:hypothetical protein BGW80DRAFT_1170516, partial [Lactifluus volemus]